MHSTRMGFPTDTQLLARMDTTMIEKALERAKNVGIISVTFQWRRQKKSFQISP